MEALKIIAKVAKRISCDHEWKQAGRFNAKIDGIQMESQILECKKCGKMYYSPEYEVKVRE